MSDPTRTPNYAAAYRTARRLERWVAMYLPAAREAAAELMRHTAVPVADTAEGTASLAKDTIAVAVLLENPGLSDSEIARRAGCDRRTLHRSTRYQKARALQAAGRRDMRQES